MTQSIEDERVEQVAKEISVLSGVSITRAVLRALEERLERLPRRRDPPKLIETLTAISNRCRALPDLDDCSADAILGYDANGAFR